MISFRRRKSTHNRRVLSFFATGELHDDFEARINPFDKFSSMYSRRASVYGFESGDKGSNGGVLFGCRSIVQSYGRMCGEAISTFFFEKNSLKSEYRCGSNENFVDIGCVVSANNDENVSCLSFAAIPDFSNRYLGQRVEAIPGQESRKNESLAEHKNRN